MQVLTDKSQLMGSLSASLMLSRKTKLHMSVVMKLVTATKTNHVEYHGDDRAMHKIPRIWNRKAKPDQISFVRYFLLFTMNW